MELIIIITALICLLYSWKYESPFNKVTMSCLLISLIGVKYALSEEMFFIANPILALTTLVLTLSILFKKNYSVFTKILVGLSGLIYLHYLNHGPGRGAMALIAILPIIGWIYWAFKEKIVISSELSFALFFFVVLTTRFGKLVISWI